MWNEKLGLIEAATVEQALRYETSVGRENVIACNALRLATVSAYSRSDSPV